MQGHVSNDKLFSSQLDDCPPANASCMCVDICACLCAFEAYLIYFSLTRFLFNSLLWLCRVGDTSWKFISLECNSGLAVKCYHSL